MTMMRQAALRAGRTAATKTQRRNMAGGGFDHRYGVNKNKFVEEWNGRREITELAFEFDAKNSFNVFFFGAVIPYGMYSLFHSELKRTGGRRYQDIA
mmetsp:Transcript_18245/g.37014  ORF Transcript_18245/g.37014 Transcript_18245/m.37014 type:complete len:97 (+) Transcript_18245:635-925(+)